MKAVTFTSTRLPGVNPPDWGEPYENILTDFTDLANRGGVTNCLMASNDNYCDSEPGTGKRIKTRLYGPGAFDTLLRTTTVNPYIGEDDQPVDISSVDYFTFGKISNFAAARITGFSIELLDADGNPMGDREAANAVLFNLGATDIGLNGGLVEGLFGSGGQEEAGVGFFDLDEARFGLTEAVDVLDFEGLTNAFHLDNFGTALLYNGIVPDGYFWDATPDIAGDEDALLTWYHFGEDTWYYGNLGETGSDFLNEKLAALAADLGVEVADLGYTAGGDAVPADIVAAMQANSNFTVAKIEDLRNANLNYTMTIGTIEEGQFTMRITPRFAQIAEETGSDYQFQTAGYLDALANVPYLDTGNAAAYGTLIDTILALDPAEQANALEETGFSFLSAFSGLGMTLGREQVFALGMPVAEVGADGTVIASQGADNFWAMGGGISGMAAINGSSGTFESTANGVGYDVDTTGFSAGVAYNVSPTVSVGVLLGASQATAEAKLNRGKIETDAVTGAVFARAVFGEGGAVQAILGYQDMSFDSTRNVGAETATGSTDGSQTFFALRGDYLFGQGALRYGPTVSLESYSQSVDGYEETGLTLGNLSIGDQENDITIASAGLRSVYDFGGGNAYGSVAYTKVSGDDSMVTTGFVGEFSGLTPVDGLDQKWVDVVIGFSTRISDAAMLGGEYRGSFGDDYENHGVRAFVSMAF
ncbi:choice-of-anchor F family protein [Yoonia sp.]|uniref:choice-of-anchor F family protein n=1 Tax=Yoonia sp. TaxID=2212373 RepID=UPI001A07C6F7|nr:choice-of-anchor F family protein [Yoonia sp.]MBE0413837.1 autotransporter outer membrane beta-barrel domain-containing protein [Yoonia sp.]